MMYITYNKESGFNIVEANSEQEAEGFDNIVLDSEEEFKRNGENVFKAIKNRLEDTNENDGRTKVIIDKQKLDQLMSNYNDSFDKNWFKEDLYELIEEEI